MNSPLRNSVQSLSLLLAGETGSTLEARRLARAGLSLICAGCSPKAGTLNSTLTTAILTQQRADGGWSDVEESLWCLSYLKEYAHSVGEALRSGLDWVVSQRSQGGGWGRSHRDRARISVTGLACTLCPEVIESRDVQWLSTEWAADLSRPTQLTYKAGFFLLGLSHPLVTNDSSLLEQTVEYLRDEQNEDGGFGPWKDHPCGSDPWSTGVVLWGLSCVPDIAPRETIRRAVEWLEANQLPNGLWPYHPIDEGSAYALIGLSRVLPLLD